MALFDWFVKRWLWRSIFADKDPVSPGKVFPDLFGL